MAAPRPGAVARRATSLSSAEKDLAAWRGEHQVGGHRRAREARTQESGELREEGARREGERRKQGGERESLILVAYDTFPELQELRLQERVIAVQPFRRRPFRIFLLWILGFLSGGVALLLAHWFRRWAFRWTHAKCFLPEATRLRLATADGGHVEVKVSRIPYSRAAVDALPLRAAPPAEQRRRRFEHSGLLSLSDASAEVTPGLESGGTRGASQDPDEKFRKRTAALAGGEQAHDCAETEGRASSELEISNAENCDDSGFDTRLSWAWMFEYRYIRYILEAPEGDAAAASGAALPPSSTFKPLVYDVCFPPEELRRRLLAAPPSADLVRLRRGLFGSSLIRVQVPSLLAFILNDVMHPFYVFQILAIALWIWDDYVQYAVAILLITAVSTVAECVQTRHNLLRLRDMSAQRCSVAVHRTVWEDTCAASSSPLPRLPSSPSSGGEGGSGAHEGASARRRKRKIVVEEIDSEDLVVGDVFEITTGMVLPCDAIILRGTVVVTESCLTGESFPIVKTPLPEGRGSGDEERGLNLEQAARHQLFAGTKVLSVRVPPSSAQGPSSPEQEPLAFAAVCRVGYATAQGRTFRTLLFPSAMRIDFETDALKFVAILSVLAGIGAVFTLVISLLQGLPPKEIFFRVFDLFTAAVPPALPASMSVGLSVAVSRLYALYSVYCTAPSRLGMGGYVRCLCFDKTGTLTEEGVRMEACLPSCQGCPSTAAPSLTAEPAPLGARDSQTPPVALLEVAAYGEGREAGGDRGDAGARRGAGEGGSCRAAAEEGRAFFLPLMKPEALRSAAGARARGDAGEARPRSKVTLAAPECVSPCRPSPWSPATLSAPARQQRSSPPRASLQPCEGEGGATANAKAGASADFCAAAIAPPPRGDSPALEAHDADADFASPRACFSPTPSTTSVSPAVSAERHWRVLCASSASALPSAGASPASALSPASSPSAGSPLGGTTACAAACDCVKHLTRCMSVCHSLLRIGGEIAGDPLELQMLTHTNWLLLDGAGGAESHTADSESRGETGEASTGGDEAMGRGTDSERPAEAATRDAAALTAPLRPLLAPRAADAAESPLTTRKGDAVPPPRRRETVVVGDVEDEHAAFRQLQSETETGGEIAGLTFMLPPDPLDANRRTLRGAQAIVRRFDFDSSLQRMSVIARDHDTGEYFVYCKGSTEMLRTLCDRHTLPEDLDDKLHHFSASGYRVIALAGRALQPAGAQARARTARCISREAAELGLTFLGLALFTNQLKPETQAVIATLLQAQCAVRIATGDHPLTSIAVARQCGLFGFAPNSSSRKEPLQAAPTRQREAATDTGEADAEGQRRGAERRSGRRGLFAARVPGGRGEAQSTLRRALAVEPARALSTAFASCSPQALWRALAGRATRRVRARAIFGEEFCARLLHSTEEEGERLAAGCLGAEGAAEDAAEPRGDRAQSGAALSALSFEGGGEWAMGAGGRGADDETALPFRVVVSAPLSDTAEDASGRRKCSRDPRQRADSAPDRRAPAREAAAQRARAEREGTAEGTEEENAKMTRAAPRQRPPGAECETEQGPPEDELDDSPVIILGDVYQTEQGEGHVGGPEYLLWTLLPQTHAARESFEREAPLSHAGDADNALGDAAGHALQPAASPGAAASCASQSSFDLRVLLAKLPDIRSASLVLTGRAFRHLKRLQALTHFPYVEECDQVVARVRKHQQEILEAQKCLGEDGDSDDVEAAASASDGEGDSPCAKAARERGRGGADPPSGLGSFSPRNSEDAEEARCESARQDVVVVIHPREGREEGVGVSDASALSSSTSPARPEPRAGCHPPGSTGGGVSRALGDRPNACGRLPFFSVASEARVPPPYAGARPWRPSATPQRSRRGKGRRRRGDEEEEGEHADVEIGDGEMLWDDEEDDHVSSWRVPDESGSCASPPRGDDSAPLASLATPLAPRTLRDAQAVRTRPSGAEETLETRQLSVAPPRGMERRGASAGEGGLRGSAGGSLLLPPPTLERETSRASSRRTRGERRRRETVFSGIDFFLETSEGFPTSCAADAESLRRPGGGLRSPGAREKRDRGIYVSSSESEEGGGDSAPAHTALAHRRDAPAETERHSKFFSFLMWPFFRRRDEARRLLPHEGDAGLEAPRGSRSEAGEERVRRRRKRAGRRSRGERDDAREPARPREGRARRHETDQEVDRGGAAASRACDAAARSRGALEREERDEEERRREEEQQLRTVVEALMFPGVAVSLLRQHQRDGETRAPGSLSASQPGSVFSHTEEAISHPRAGAADAAGEESQTRRRDGDAGGASDEDEREPEIGAERRQARRRRRAACEKARAGEAGGAENVEPQQQAAKGGGGGHEETQGAAQTAQGPSAVGEAKRRRGGSSRRSLHRPPPPRHAFRFRSPGEEEPLALSSLFPLSSALLRSTARLRSPVLAESLYASKLLLPPPQLHALSSEEAAGSDEGSHERGDRRTGLLQAAAAPGAALGCCAAAAGADRDGAPASEREEALQAEARSLASPLLTSSLASPEALESSDLPPLSRVDCFPSFFQRAEQERGAQASSLAPLLPPEEKENVFGDAFFECLGRPQAPTAEEKDEAAIVATASALLHLPSSAAAFGDPPHAATCLAFSAPTLVSRGGVESGSEGRRGDAASVDESDGGGASPGGQNERRGERARERTGSRRAEDDGTRGKVAEERGEAQRTTRASPGGSLEEVEEAETGSHGERRRRRMKRQRVEDLHAAHSRRGDEEDIEGAGGPEQTEGGKDDYHDLEQKGSEGEGTKAKKPDRKRREEMHAAGQEMRQSEATEASRRVRTGAKNEPQTEAPHVLGGEEATEKRKELQAEGGEGRPTGEEDTGDLADGVAVAVAREACKGTTATPALSQDSPARLHSPHAPPVNVWEGLTLQLRVLQRHQQPAAFYTRWSLKRSAAEATPPPSSDHAAAAGCSDALLACEAARKETKKDAGHAFVFHMSLYEYVVRQTVVLCRASPQDKGEFISALQDLPAEPFVAMCGDGTNDAVAIKQADVGVSILPPSVMGERLRASSAAREEPALPSGASLASSFSAVSLWATVQLLLEGRCMVMNSFSTFKFIACYSVIQFTSVLLLYAQAGNLTDAQYMWIDLFTILPLSVTLARTNAADSLSPLTPPRSLVSAPILVSLLGQLVIQVFFQILALVLLCRQPFYVPFIPDTSHDLLRASSVAAVDGGDSLAGFENTVVFLVSSMQYIFCCAAFTSSSFPWRKAIWTNHQCFAGMALLLLASVAFLLFAPSDLPAVIAPSFAFLASWLRLRVSAIPRDFRLKLLQLVACNGLLSLLFEVGVVRRLLERHVEESTSKSSRINSAHIPADRRKFTVTVVYP
ncbi:hypothetical protein BESB_039940 [Besnoitia besnoiti]|uniref:Cation-transporting ATPase n=1 Tax=Besnoitia besnoiti TaxID=94643 RepID=A0A2A9MN05_BESBE|nr:hypothetical protein BESB_039940 [Besnoitia besnoiti]PFH37536.1 hypothetical protein BESB_039940 [Besnoitia besnoiti]